MSSYLIKEGKYNASGLHIGVHFGIKEQSYKVRFSKECLYTMLNWENDWNKLCGWSYGLLPVKWEEGFSSSPDFRLFGVDYVWAHHYNSIRVCWRSKESGIELCIYVYENGIRKTSMYTLNILPEYEYSFVVGKEDEKVSLLVPDILTGITVKYVADIKWGYRLFPVFGGNDKAPHDMRIELERI